MSSTLVITVTSDQTEAQLQQAFQLAANNDRQAALALSSFFKGLASGETRGTIDVQTGSVAPVKASGTFTLASVVEDEAITIAGTTLTFKDSPSGENQIQTGGASDAADAIVAAAAINAHSTLSTLVDAEASAAVVTVTAKVAGVAGNQIAISETGTTITASGANLANGAGGATGSSTQYSLGL